ncbi:DUF5412 family protein [Clostridium nigeriense]|uniref:DUF5412 family protein n=1 Tax=Clostridium nigeriense TaxID=1805470 RepID=UPI00083016C5|nr:DUF5412 family protein [Clostridium nigeriense]
MNNFNPIVHQRVGIVEGRVYEKNRNGEIKNIYWQYNCKKADLEWLSDEVIKINGVKLNVKKEIYDYRR